MAGNLQELKSENFKNEVLESKIPVLVDFGADWCMPCRMIAPSVEELSNDYAGRVKFAKVDVDNNPELATNFQILSIPALLIFKDGKEIKRIQGALPKEAMQQEIDGALA